MKVSSLRKDDLSNDIIQKMLYNGLEDNGDNGNCIMVLGSLKAPKYRIPKAVSIYRENRASKILLCGGVAWVKIHSCTRSFYILPSDIVSAFDNEYQ